MSYCPAILKGLPKDCAPSKGGVKRVFIASYPEDAVDVNDIYGFTGTTVQGTVVNYSNAVVSDAKSGITWYEYSFRKGGATLTSTLTVDPASGGYVSTELALTFARIEAAKRAEVAAMALSDMAVVVELQNGTVLALGVDDPVTATGGSANSGANASDANNYQITLTDEFSTWPVTVGSEAFTKIKTSAASGNPIPAQA